MSLTFSTLLIYYSIEKNEFSMNLFDIVICHKSLIYVYRFHLDEFVTYLVESDRMAENQ